MFIKKSPEFELHATHWLFSSIVVLGQVKQLFDSEPKHVKQVGLHLLSHNTQVLLEGSITNFKPQEAQLVLSFPVHVLQELSQSLQTGY